MKKGMRIKNKNIHFIFVYFRDEFTIINTLNSSLIYCIFASFVHLLQRDLQREKAQIFMKLHILEKKKKN